MAAEKYHENDSMLPKEDLKPKPWAKCKFFGRFFRAKTLKNFVYFKKSH